MNKQDWAREYKREASASIYITVNEKQLPTFQEHRMLSEIKKTYEELFPNHARYFSLGDGNSIHIYGRKIHGRKTAEMKKRSQEETNWLDEYMGQFRR